jgi:anaerobic magnesium-protoporphyrin IX monomethyl ester cyclase
LSRWDYKHQVLESSLVPNWRVLLWVKSIEAICQLRPKSLIRLLAHPDPLFRAGMRWYSSIGRRVWTFEVWQWLFHDRRTGTGPALTEFLKAPWKQSSVSVGKFQARNASGSELLAKTPVLSYPINAPMHNDA